MLQRPVTREFYTLNKSVYFKVISCTRQNHFECRFSKSDPAIVLGNCDSVYVIDETGHIVLCTLLDVIYHKNRPDKGTVVLRLDS